jgi:DNA-binding IclR family transcriptional regulator
MPFWKSRKKSEEAGETAFNILRILALSGISQSCSQLMKATGKNSGYVINALPWLHKQGYVESRGKMSRISIATDKTTFSASSQGRRRLQEQR